jgi:hypothetical protein
MAYERMSVTDIIEKDIETNNHGITLEQGVAIFKKYMDEGAPIIRVRNTLFIIDNDVNKVVYYHTVNADPIKSFLTNCLTFFSLIKKGIFYTTILLTVAFISSGFKPYNSQISKYLFADENEQQSYVFPSQNSIDYFKLKVPFTGRYFIGFKEAVAHKESQGKYGKINSLGYMGKYQFGVETLKSIGINDSIGFMNNPRLQEKAFVALLSKNKYNLKDYINYFEGKIVDGVKITESGILAAAHLGGPGSVKRFLNSNGEKKCKDDYGTSVKTYMKDFGGYETTGIKAVKNAKVN